MKDILKKLESPIALIIGILGFMIASAGTIPWLIAGALLILAAIIILVEDSRRTKKEKQAKTT
ncbi:MAG: hypothetical protein ACLQO7_08065 [Candidatus Bathyarchaeia archaeon]